jgi:hypothetical protein
MAAPNIPSISSSLLRSKSHNESISPIRDDVITSPTLPQEEAHDTKKRTNDENSRPKLDEEIVFNNEEDLPMESSLTPIPKSDQVPDLSGLVAKLQPNAIFDGTYSTVFRGLYGEHEVCFSDIHVLRLTVPR